MRCTIQLKPAQEKIRRPFKFVNAIGTLPGFLPMIKRFWDDTEVLFHSTSALYRFSKKIQILKPLIRELGREGLGNLKRRAKETYEVLCDKQKETLQDPSEVAVQEEAIAYENWLKVASLEEDFLKQRSKLHWLDVGDHNNKAFYNAIRSRQAQNMIREVRCVDGSTVSEHKEIKKEAESFFSNLLNMCPDEYKGTTVDELRDLLEYRCSLDDCIMLEAEVTAEEIKKVLFAMPANKSPGPDGYPCEFFKQSWDITGRDFVVAI